MALKLYNFADFVMQCCS